MLKKKNARTSYIVSSTESTKHSQRSAKARKPDSNNWFWLGWESVDIKRLLDGESLQVNEAIDDSFEQIRLNELYRSCITF